MSTKVILFKCVRVKHSRKRLGIFPHRSSRHRRLPKSLNNTVKQRVCKHTNTPQRISYFSGKACCVFSLFNPHYHCA